MTRILLIGENGQVGYEVRRLLQDQPGFLSLDSSQLNLADGNAIRKTISELSPALVINAAAYTAVDAAENEKAQAFAINAAAPGIIAEQLSRAGGAMIHYSTDFVFDGSQSVPYAESDEPKPLNVYGASKLAGDDAIANSGVPHVILRTGWVYGTHGNNFPKTISRALRRRETVNVVDDQVGTPTWSRDIASATERIVSFAGDDPVSTIGRFSGVYHFAASGRATWFEIAERIASRMRASGLRIAEVRPIGTAQFGAAANRPRFSVLDTARIQSTFGVTVPAWQASFDRFLADLERVATPD